MALDPHPYPHTEHFGHFGFKDEGKVWGFWMSSSSRHCPGQVREEPCPCPPAHLCVPLAQNLSDPHRLGPTLRCRGPHPQKHIALAEQLCLVCGALMLYEVNAPDHGIHPEFVQLWGRGGAEGTETRGWRLGCGFEGKKL